MEKTKNDAQTATIGNTMLAEVKPCGWVSIKDELPNVGDVIILKGYKNKFSQPSGVVGISTGKDLFVELDITFGGYFTVFIDKFTHWMRVVEV